MLEIVLHTEPRSLSIGMDEQKQIQDQLFDIQKRLQAIHEGQQRLGRLTKITIGILVALAVFWLLFDLS